MDRVDDATGERCRAIEFVEVVLDLPDELVVLSCRACVSFESLVGLDGLAQVLQCVVEPGPDRADGRSHGLGRFGRRQSDVVDQHDHRPVLDAEPPERLVELVLGGDAGAGPGTGSVGCQQPRLPR